jgi:signal transduction histidine kinase
MVPSSSHARRRCSDAWIVNLGCIELHPHPVRSGDLDHPDELRIDLDPIPGVSWDDVRRVAVEVQGFLDEVGLRSALHLYLEGFMERSKIKVDFDVPDNFGRLPQEMETTIFRVVQECLTNIHRHSGSIVAKVRVVRIDKQLRVEVEDEGKGIPPEKQEAMHSGRKLGVGITGMQERLRQLGGSLEINSSASGTLVVAKLPVMDTSSHAVA